MYPKGPYSVVVLVLSRKQKQNLTIMQNFECMCIIFMTVRSFNGGSQSGCYLHQSLITAANQTSTDLFW